MTGQTGTDGQRTDKHDRTDKDDRTDDGTDGRTEDDDGDDGTRRQGQTEDGRRRRHGRRDGRTEDDDDDDGTETTSWTDRRFVPPKFQIQHWDQYSNVHVCRPQIHHSGRAQTLPPGDRNLKDLCYSLRGSRAQKEQLGFAAYVLSICSFLRTTTDDDG